MNFSEIKAKAKLKRVTLNKQIVFLRHMANRGRIQDTSSTVATRVTDGDEGIPKESVYHAKVKEMMKSRQVGKTALSKADVEIIDQQRKLARDANKAELAQNEINTFGYPLFEYLVKMKKCSYVSFGEKCNRFGTYVKFFFYSDKRCQ